MFHIENARVKELLLQGNIGLERESLRVTAEGRMAKTPHPFDPTEPHITRDFCENQVEINTGVFPSAEAAVGEVDALVGRIERTLASREERELLWPFSNPPYLEDEEDIPIANFDGAGSPKTEYRRRLANNYGRYKMTFCGVHCNYSFSDELLEEDFKLSGMTEFQEYKNLVYLELAEKAAEFGWILTAVSAASPILDGSFVRQGVPGTDLFFGMGSPRCSEFGYWNHFAPILEYAGAREYAASVQRYVDMGLIHAPTELYYPIRLKPRGANDLRRLAEEGVDHIELRMFDLNPLLREGIDARDVSFAQLFLVFLASTPRRRFEPKAQVRAVQNFKNAARYDLGLVKLLTANSATETIAVAGGRVVDQMKKFYADASDAVHEVLRFEEEKFVSPEKRYPYAIYRRFHEGYAEKGLALATEYQKSYCEDVGDES